MKLRKIIALILCFILALSLFSCKDDGREIKPRAKTIYRHFNTVSAVYSYLGDSEEEFGSNYAIVEATLVKWHKLLDIYFPYSGLNNLYTLNRMAGKGPVELAPELIDFLLYCKEIHTLTGGRVNIAFGAVTALWHDERELALDEDNPSPAKLPSLAALEEAALHTDINCLVIDKENSTAEITDAKMRLDVGAVGKGYAAELAAKELRAKGVSSYVLNIGGNLICLGEKPNGDGWSTGITNPDKSSNSFATTTTLKDTACVTSGDYERYYVVDGKNYHHIIDPATLMPAEYFSSVTVLCSDSALADALSTALFCLSYEDGLALVESIGGIDVLWIKADGTQYKTDGFDR